MFSGSVRKILSVSLVLLSFVFSPSCKGDDVNPNDELADMSVSYEELEGLDTLRVLAVGNSFTVDPTVYIGRIVEASGIDTKRCCVYRLVTDGKDLAYWNGQYDDGSEHKIYAYAGGINMPVTKGTVKALFAQKWDVVVFQQLSSKSYDYSTFVPYLTNLISHVKEDCPNKSVLFAWQMTWSYWNGYSLDRPRGEQGWRDIVNATKEMMYNVGIKIVIPTGTAIENARHSDLNNEYDLTDDGRHLCRGTGRYVAACTWFEALFRPVFGVGIVGNGMRYYEADREKEVYRFDAPLVDTDEKAEACQKMAEMAVAHWDAIVESADSAD